MESSASSGGSGSSVTGSDTDESTIEETEDERVAPQQHAAKQHSSSQHSTASDALASSRAMAIAASQLFNPGQRGLIQQRSQDTDGVVLSLRVMPSVHSSQLLYLRYFYAGAMPRDEVRTPCCTGAAW